MSTSLSWDSSLGNFPFFDKGIFYRINRKLCNQNQRNQTTKNKINAIKLLREKGNKMVVKLTK